MQSSSCYIEYSSHFFWNVNFLTDISDVEKSKICLTVQIRKRRFYLPLSHTISLDGSLPSNIFSFSCVVMRSKKLMTICCADGALINCCRAQRGSILFLTRHGFSRVHSTQSFARSMYCRDLDLCLSVCLSVCRLLR